MAPTLRPRYSASIAWAASSTTGIPVATSGIEVGWLPGEVDRHDRLRPRRDRRDRQLGSMLRSSSRTSTKTGRAPRWTATLAVAGQVIGDVMTSSPGPMPRPASERWRAAVPEASASACFAPVSSATRSSSSAARGPVVSQPLAERLRDGGDLLRPDRGGLEGEEGFPTGRELLHRPSRSVLTRPRGRLCSSASSRELPVARTKPARSAPRRSGVKVHPGRR